MIDYRDSPALFWYKEIKNQLIYQDFTAVYVKYTNMEGFCIAVVTYVKLECHPSSFKWS